MFNQNTSGYSLSDIASALGGKGGLFGDGNGAATLLIIIFLFCFMGGFGGIGGNSAIDTAALLSMNNTANRAVTTDDLQNQFNFAALERENGEIIAAVGQSKYDNINVMKDIQSQLQMQLSGLSTMEQAIGDKVNECLTAVDTIAA